MVIIFILLAIINTLSWYSIELIDKTPIKIAVGIAVVIVNAICVYLIMSKLEKESNARIQMINNQFDAMYGRPAMYDEYEARQASKSEKS